MPWKERSKTMLRKEFVEDVLTGKLNKSEACRKYGISRPTGDKWIARMKNGESMDDRSKKPFKTANRINRETEDLIVSYRKEYPAIGAVKIHRMLENEHIKDIPSSSTINNIFKRNGLISEKASNDSTPNKRFEMEEPNEMWQGDFKGNFTMLDGIRCHPLNIIDDCTRFNICCYPLMNETYESVMPQMIRIFKEYGLPRVFLCDNGNPWGTPQSTGFSRFEVDLMDLGILTMHGRIRHPQTQGKEERFNGSLTRECLDLTQIENIEDAEKKLFKYRNFYNNTRPHHALKLDTPASRYKVSPRKYPNKIESWEYPDGYILHKVKKTGFITYRGQGYFLSESFGEKTIAIKESSIPGCITLCYRQFKIGRIDIDKRVFTFKKIYLAENDPRFAPNEK